MIVQLAEIKVLRLSVARLHVLFVSRVRLPRPGPLVLLKADFLASSPDSIRRVTDDSVENRPYRETLPSLIYIELDYRDVHHSDLWLHNAVVFEVREYIEFVNFF